MSPTTVARIEVGLARSAEGDRRLEAAIGILRTAELVGPLESAAIPEGEGVRMYWDGVRELATRLPSPQQRALACLAADIADGRLGERMGQLDERGRALAAAMLAHALS